MVTLPAELLTSEVMVVPPCALRTMSPVVAFRSVLTVAGMGPSAFRSMAIPYAALASSAGAETASGAAVEPIAPPVEVSFTPAPP